jgi:hypothetical protein
MWALINYNSDGNSRIILWSISLVAGALSAITGPIVKSTLQNVTQPQMRGMAFALLTTFDDFGKCWVVLTYCLPLSNNVLTLNIRSWLVCRKGPRSCFCRLDDWQTRR